MDISITFGAMKEIETSTGFYSSFNVSDLISLIAIVAPFLLAYILTKKNNKADGNIDFDYEIRDVIDFKGKQYLIPVLIFTNLSKYPVYIKRVSIHFWGSDKYIYDRNTSVMTNYFSLLRARRKKKILYKTDSIPKEPELKNDKVEPQEQIKYNRFLIKEVTYRDIVPQEINTALLKLGDKRKNNWIIPVEAMKDDDLETTLIEAGIFDKPKFDELYKKYTENLFLYQKYEVEVKKVEIILSNNRPQRMRRKDIRRFSDIYNKYSINLKESNQYKLNRGILSALKGLSTALEVSTENPKNPDTQIPEKE